MYGTTIMYVTSTLVLCAGLLPTQVLSYVSTEWYRCPYGIARNGYLRTYNEKCYEFVTTEEYWGVANSKCNQKGGHLIEIRDYETQLFVKNSLQALRWGTNGLWIGAHDSANEGSWKWVTGGAVTWAYWASGQPEWCFFPCIEDCANLRLDEGYRWHDKPCDSFAYHYTYICQYNMGPRTTTTTTTTTTPAPTTPAPTTPAPTTPKPTTPAPTTPAPTTQAPTTPKPTTPAPTTPKPTTPAPTTPAPTTPRPTTPAPTTTKPTTLAHTTPKPTTPALITPKPTTPAPTTPKPTTPAPTTPKPTTPAPTTPAPTTPRPTTPASTTTKHTTPIPTTTPTEGGSVTSATHSAAFSTDALIGLVIGLLAAVCILLVLVGFLLLRRCKLRKQKRSNIPIGFHNVGYDSSTEQVRVTDSRTTDNIYVNAAGLPTSRPRGTYVYDNRQSNPYDVPDKLNVNDVDSGKEFSKSSYLDELPDLQVDLSGKGGACGGDYDTLKTSYYDDDEGDTEHYVRIPGDTKSTHDTMTSPKTSNYDQIDFSRENTLNSETENYLRVYDPGNLDKTQIAFVNNLFAKK